MTHAAITGIGAYLPERRLTNADLERLVDTTDEWITTRTGIRERGWQPRARPPLILRHARGWPRLATRA